MKNYTFTILLLWIISINSNAQNTAMHTTTSAEKTVRDFLETVRSGKSPERVSEFMADSVKAHQLNSEHPEIINRTPANYAQHVNEFIQAYGHYQFEVTELIASNDKVYARWKQTGNQIQDVEEFKATGLPVTEIGSAVYRVEDGKIVEYWIQVDRKGTEIQQQNNSNIKSGTSKGDLPFPDAYIFGDALYISGQIGLDQTGELIKGGFEAEASKVMENLGNVLRKNKLHYKNLINVTVYLTTMDNYVAFNNIYRKYFDKKFPARVCVAVKELPRQAQIEIAAVAGFNY
ncbi:reactive intermediate/imine deaminase [Mucilaginibacter frigoritolerans]|jgi:reactive intermediate/imine deaminase|uniref:Reactive intermediate/imine deaminase n=1 Tax=Mucilaginibacter frigoritolerans TaxID=652788 RepID=A0A562U9B2_9SPHI|nr:Rid family detoxifying hydrolase [Mucilaginibacter frigoritolerans]TWJ02400.1 reactive intermediate/imine deaminase [Mucilaginibacter frigoritolerans]